MFSKEWRDQAGPNVQGKNPIHSVDPLDQHRPYNNGVYKKWDELNQEEIHFILGIEFMINELCHFIQLKRKELGMNLMEKPFIYLYPIQYNEQKINRKQRDIFFQFIKDWDAYIKNTTNVELILLYVPVQLRTTSITLPAGSKNELIIKLAIDKELISKHYKYALYA